MNGVSFSLKKYKNGSCFVLSLVYEWGGVRGLQPHIRTQTHGKLPPLVKPVYGIPTFPLAIKVV